MNAEKEIKDQLKRPVRDLRISVTDRCNFRCAYCMPAEIYGERYEFLDQDSLLTFEEITRITNLLVKIGVKRGRQENPNLKIGICGEHGGDAKSIQFFNEIGLNYVSCSPYRVPIARLAAAQSEIIKQQL